MDIRPENIMFKNYPDFLNGPRPLVKLIDLGNAKKVNNSVVHKRTTNPEYRPPEIILGVPIDEKVDCWAIGNIIAELLIGTYLFGLDEEKKKNLSKEQCCFELVSMDSYHLFDVYFYYKLFIF